MVEGTRGTLGSCAAIASTPARVPGTPSDKALALEMTCSVPRSQEPIAASRSHASQV
jgi:hypothetical protein